MTFLVLPTLLAIIAAFGASRFPVFPPQGWTVEWFTSIDPSYGQAAVTSVKLACYTSILSVLFGVPAAFAIARWKGRGATLMQALVRAPMQVPYVVIGVMMLQYFVVISQSTGVPMVGTLRGLVIAHSVVAIPYMIGAVYPTASILNRSLDEAAYGLGASRFYTFATVILPSLRNSIVAGVVFAFLVSFDDVPISLFLVGSEFQTLPVKLFFAAEFSYTPELFAVSTVATLLTCAAILLINRLIGAQKMAGVESL